MAGLSGRAKPALDGSNHIRGAVCTKAWHPAVEVHVFNNAARRFYQKYGLLPLRDAPQQLFLPTHRIRKRKLAPL
jgi:hypothetical protein